MILFGILLFFIIFSIGITIYINHIVNKDLIKDYGHLAILGSVWVTTHGYNVDPWDPIHVKIINNKSYKNKRYVTYMILETGEELTCELAYFLSYFTFKHS